MADLRSPDREAVVRILERAATAALRLAGVAKGLEPETTVRELAQSTAFQAEMTTFGHALLDVSQLFQHLESHQE